MFTTREVFHCKPGRAGDLVSIFKKVAPAMKEFGFLDARIYTDISGEHYWTVVLEQDVQSIDGLAELSRKTMSDPKVANLFTGYHELILDGRREIYKRE
jgi:hypothetical protein